MFSKKNQGIYVDLNDHTFTVARTTGGPGAITVEELKSCPANNAEAIGALLEEIQPKRGGAGKYVSACCAVYPPTRLVRKATIEPKRVNEPNYFNEVVSAQYRISPDEYTLAALSPATGRDLHAVTANEKEAVFAGMLNSEVSTAQKRLLELGIFPEALELGTLSILGALVNYRAAVKSTVPTLVLEVGDASTNSFVLGDDGLATSRQIAQGIDAMVPIVQKELGLKDEESARRLFYSNTFDFTGMAASFTKKLIKELQSSIGFYEVQTGQSIGQVICTLLPSKLEWMQTAISTQLGVEALKIAYDQWLPAAGVTLPKAGSLDTSSLGLVSLLVRK